MLRKTQQQLQFNQLAYIYPPDQQKSNTHRLANRIFRKIDIQNETVETCECCGRYVGEESEAGTFQYDPLKQLEYLGPGVPLLFTFTKNTIITELITIVVISLMAIILNSMNDACELLDCNQKGIFEKLSLSSNVRLFELLVTVNFVFTIIWIPVNQFFVYRCRAVETKADEDKLTPSDFAIFLLNLPENTTHEDIEQTLNKKRKSIKARLKVQGLSEERRNLLKEVEDFKVQKIIIPFKVANYVQQQQEQEAQFIKHVKEDKTAEFLRNYIPKPSELVNMAIVVFEKQITKSFFLQTRNIVTQLKQCVCNWGSDPNTITVKDKRVTVTRAAEPDDIIWENLQISFKSILLSKLTTFMFACLILLVGGIIQYWLAVWQLQNLSANLYTFVVVFSAVLVTFTNFLILLLIMWATKKEGNFTKSKYNASLNIKVCLFQFFNTGIFYTFSNIIAIELTDTHLAQTMQEIFATKITVCMIVDALTEGLLILLIGYFQLPKSIFRLLMNHKIIYCSQKVCNQLHQLNDSLIPQKYAYLIKTLWLTCFYTPFVPIVAFISLFGLILFYLAMKISFRHFYKITSVRSNQTNIRALRLSYFSPFMLNLSIFIIYHYYSDSNFVVNFSTKVILYISLSFSAVYGVLPWYHINEAIFPLKVQSNYMYSNVKHHFQMTYEDKLLKPFEMAQKSKKNENYFLLHQVKRVSIKEKVDYKSFFNHYLRQSKDLKSNEALQSCREFFRNSIENTPRK